MDPLFSRMTKRFIPPMNRKVMDGMAVEEMKYVEEFLDGQIRSICKGFPKALRYIGYQRCSSQEEYEEITRLRSNRRTFDLAHSSVYMVKYFFIFTDLLGTEHQIIRYIHLPYVTRAGIMSISGTNYHIVPILSDKVITPSNNSIFVRLTQDKNNVFRIYNSFMVDKDRKTFYTAWATIHGSPDAKRSGSHTKRSKTLLTHYLFGRYGFSGAFNRYVGTVPIYGYGDDITVENYPEKDWIICQSTGVKPDSCQEKFYIPNKIKLAIPRDRWSIAMEAFVSGFFYVTDHYPDRFALPTEFKEEIDSDGVVNKTDVKLSIRERHDRLTARLEDKSLWMILVGLILFGALRGENVLYKEMMEHFDSLQDYLDEASQKKLAEKGVVLENYYDLLSHVAININEIIRDAGEVGMNVYGKNLEVLSYVFYDITHGFTSMKFALVKAASRRPLTSKNVIANFQQFVKPGKIFMIHTGKIISKAVSYSGDHMYPTITAVMTEQENRAGATRGQKSRTVVGPQHRIELSMIAIGSVLNLPKASPTPLSRINPWITIDERTGTVIENPKLSKLIRENNQYFKF